MPMAEANGHSNMPSSTWKIVRLSENRFPEFQALRHKVAELSAEVEVCKTFNYQVARSLGDGNYPVKEASMSKLISTKVADEVAYECLQLLGATATWKIIQWHVCFATAAWAP